MRHNYGMRNRHVEQRKGAKKFRKCTLQLGPAFSKEKNNQESASHLNTGIRPNTIIDITPSIRW